MTTKVDWFTSGRILDITPEEYVRYGSNYQRGDVRRVMSRSELVEFSRCPRRWRRGIKDKPTDSMEWGNLIDCLLLTPEQFQDRYAIAPKTYMEKGMQCPKCGGVTSSAKCKKCKTERVPVEVPKDWNRNATYCSEWEAEYIAKGMAVLKEQEASDAWAAIAILKKNDDIQYILDHSKTQVPFIVEYHDEDTGVHIPVKGMIDLVPGPSCKFGDMLIDVKTAATASPRAYAKEVERYGYHVQSALYMDAFNYATSLNYTQFGHIIQENFPPYEESTRKMSAEFVQSGRAAYRRALTDYAYCLANDWWPGYDEYQNPGLKGWGVIEPESWMIGGQL